MSEQTVFLESIHIKNYRSLHDVVIPFRPLTVLVGPNASGKTNFIKSLFSFQRIVKYGAGFGEISSNLWLGGKENMVFELHFNHNTSARYKIQLRAERGNTNASEELWLGETAVISIYNGQGEVWDENENGNIITFKSQAGDQLALKSAGNYGHKPITSAIYQFINGWKFYDFDLSQIRRNLDHYNLNNYDEDESRPKFHDNSLLRSDGFKLNELLIYWANEQPERFEAVNNSLQQTMQLKIEYLPIDPKLPDVKELFINEGYKTPIRLHFASDGTLRLIAYYMLLHTPDLPPLITIEEPEQNFHPAALLEIAHVLEQLSQRTQVIITTHSSQLLDCFNEEDLGKNLGILFLRNHSGQGTEVINLEKIRPQHPSFDGWMSDFGLGNAIFVSGLLQSLMES